MNAYKKEPGLQRGILNLWYFTLALEKRHLLILLPSIAVA